MILDVWEASLTRSRERRKEDLQRKVSVCFAYQNKRVGLLHTKAPRESQDANLSIKTMLAWNQLVKKKKAKINKTGIKWSFVTLRAPSVCKGHTGGWRGSSVPLWILGPHVDSRIGLRRSLPALPPTANTFHIQVSKLGSQTLQVENAQRPHKAAPRALETFSDEKSVQGLGMPGNGTFSQHSDKQESGRAATIADFQEKWRITCFPKSQFPPNASELFYLEVRGKKSHGKKGLIGTSKYFGW